MRSAGSNEIKPTKGSGGGNIPTGFVSIPRNGGGWNSGSTRPPASFPSRISRQTPSDWPRQGFLALKPLRMRVHAEVTLRAVLAHAYEGRRDPVHDWLMGRLLDIWTDVLGGNLAVSTPSRGGPPTGPLVRFMCAIAELVLEAGRLSPFTVRTIVRARRKG